MPQQSVRRVRGRSRTDASLRAALDQRAKVLEGLRDAELRAAQSLDETALASTEELLAQRIENTLKVCSSPSHEHCFTSK